MNEPEVVAPADRSPSALFASYLDEHDEADAEVSALFAELLDEATSVEEDR